MPAANTANAPAKKITKKQAAKAELDATIKHVLATGDALAVKHTNYYDTYITKGNSVLNALLTEIMEFAEIIFASTDVNAVIKAIRNTLKNSYKIKVQKNSNDIAVIVRYITRTNRKNAHVYARVIKLAFDAGKTSAELGNFIDENGGVSKIREKDVNVAEAELVAKNKKAIKLYTKDWLEDIAKNNAIATFEVDEKLENKLHDMTCGSVFKFMICKQIGGKYMVIDAMVNLDKKLEEKVFMEYFNYKFSMYARYNGGKENAFKEFGRRMQENIDRYNGWRAEAGRKLLNIYGDEIQEEVEENNEIV